jgi:acetyl-CoA carboxylase carboxyltransferase component
MGPEGAVNILHRRELAQAGENTESLRAEKLAAYKQKFANPYLAASRGYINTIIPPAETRMRIISALEALQNKRQPTSARKHGNIPL